MICYQMFKAWFNVWMFENTDLQSVSKAWIYKFFDIHVFVNEFTNEIYKKHVYAMFTKCLKFENDFKLFFYVWLELHDWDFINVFIQACSLSNV